MHDTTNIHSNYKPLGGYIKQVNVRNKGIVTDNLQGLSMSKEFRKSTSNIVGTDLSKYKLVNKWQFACDFMSVIRVHKLPVVLHTLNEAVIISPAYTVFEVIDEEELSPEYLMMWFRRPEFDRYADFRCDSAIRGGFKWEELCEVKLPIPSIEKQREIVKEYNTIVNRINLNEQLNLKLEETAQALYKHWFLDFEFPNEEGQPYKSSCGNMVYNEELDKEIPEGWDVSKVADLIEYKKGNAFKSKDYSNSGIPIIRVSDLTHNSIDLTECYYIDEKASGRYAEYKLQTNDIIITTVGSWPQNPASVVGKVVKVPIIRNQGLLNQNMVRLRTKNTELQLILLSGLYRKEFSEFVISGAQGSANQASVTLQHLFSFNFCIPKEDEIKLFSKPFKRMYRLLNTYNEEIISLKEMATLLLAKMTKVETEKELAH